MDTKQWWEQHARALICAMGHDQLPTAPAAPRYRVVMCPAFHAPCCLTLAFGADEGELCLSILSGSQVDAGAGVGRADSDQRAASPCLEALVALDRAASGDLRQRLAACQPALLGDRLLAARDGIYVQCRYADQQIAHTIHMSSPSAADAPQHLRLMRTLLAAARAHIEDLAVQQYLATLGRYFR